LCVIYFCLSLLYQIALSCSFLNFDCLCQISQSLVEFRKERKAPSIKNFTFVCVPGALSNLSIYLSKIKKNTISLHFFRNFWPKTPSGSCLKCLQKAWSHPVQCYYLRFAYQMGMLPPLGLGYHSTLHFVLERIWEILFVLVWHLLHPTTWEAMDLLQPNSL